MPENTAASNENQKIPLTINAWKSKLLDLTKRNRALNFKPNKVSTVTITDEQATEIFRLLCVQCKSLKFKAKPETPEETARRKAKENAAKSKKADAPSPLVSAVIPTESASGEIFNADDDAEENLSSPNFVPYDAAALGDQYTDDFLQTNAFSDKLDTSLRRLE